MGHMYLARALYTPSTLSGLTSDLRPAGRTERRSASRTPLRTSQLTQGDSRRVLGSLVAGFDTVKDLFGEQNRVSSWLLHGINDEPPRNQTAREKLVKLKLTHYPAAPGFPLCAGGVGKETRFQKTKFRANWPSKVEFARKKSLNRALMSDFTSGILSIDPLFSYTFPDRPSFLTSFWFCVVVADCLRGWEPLAGAELRQAFIAILAYTIRLTLSRGKWAESFFEGASGRVVGLPPLPKGSRSRWRSCTSPDPQR